MNKLLSLAVFSALFAGASVSAVFADEANSSTEKTAVDAAHTDEVAEDDESAEDEAKKPVASDATPAAK